MFVGRDSLITKEGSARKEKKRPREKFVVEKLAGSVAESRAISGVERVVFCKMPVKGAKN